MEQDLLGQLVSPEVHADRTVTFRLEAPHADEVLVQGLAGIVPQALAKSSGDIWEVTVGPLTPELYSYTFRVDGMTVTDPHNRHVKKWLSVENLVEVPGDPPLLHQQQSVPHGVVHHHVYASQTTGTERGAYIYTPPGYGRSEGASFPLLVLMHGYGDDESAWLEVGRAHWIADNLIALGRAVPLIIAMPYGHPLPLEKRSTFEDYITRNEVMMQKELLGDLLPLLAREYRVTEDRQQRAMAGLSMGGGQSLTIGLQNLDAFAWIGGFSSATPRGDLTQQFADALRDVPVTNQRLGLLWIGCGKEDFLLERNEQFHGWLDQHGLEHTYQITDGGHDWMVWRKYLAEFLPLLFRGAE